ncbi:MAG TPA: hypothetical protein PK691_07780, partial [Thermomicrobiales bacterium]|nr:hypothetical protein [Thermomicrobiales bacterium]
MIDRPSRKSVRLPGYDYAGPGTFFLTICTFGRRQIFGEVIESQGHLSEGIDFLGFHLQWRQR